MRITTIAVDSCVANVVQINGNCTSSPLLFKKVDNAIHCINHFQEEKAIGHFRVPKTLTFKVRLGAQPFL